MSAHAVKETQWYYEKKFSKSINSIKKTFISFKASISDIANTKLLLLFNA